MSSHLHPTTTITYTFAGKREWVMYGYGPEDTAKAVADLTRPRRGGWSFRVLSVEPYCKPAPSPAS